MKTFFVGGLPPTPAALHAGRALTMLLSVLTAGLTTTERREGIKCTAVSI